MWFNYPRTLSCLQLSKNSVNKRSKRGVNRRATHNKAPIPSQVSFKGQTMLNVNLPGIPLKFTSTITTGIIAAETALNVLSSTIGVQGFSTRFSTVFREYRLRGCTIELIPLGIYTGATYFFLNEKSLGAPTYFEAFSQEAVLIKNNEQKPVNRSISWVNRDTSDASWNSTSSNYTSAWMSIYTDNANLGSPVVASEMWVYRVTWHVSLRGLSST